jgi:hypothetical protein
MHGNETGGLDRRAGERHLDRGARRPIRECARPPFTYFRTSHLRTSPPAVARRFTAPYHSGY